jgi:5-carboxymethyl-2-hydroxymuconate isomerase
LSQHITLLQLPRMLLRPSTYQGVVPTLHTSLLASAMYNSASAASPRARRARLQTLRMADRIRNCTTIAAHLSLPTDAPFADPNTKPEDLMRHLCTAASTSIHCQEYIYVPTSHAWGFRTFSEADAYLEVALLVVLGYSTESILYTMVKLSKEGKLALYAKDSAKNIVEQWNMESITAHYGSCCQ